MTITIHHPGGDHHLPRRTLTMLVAVALALALVATAVLVRASLLDGDHAVPPTRTETSSAAPSDPLGFLFGESVVRAYDSANARYSSPIGWLFGTEVAALYTELGADVVAGAFGPPTS